LRNLFWWWWWWWKTEFFCAQYELLWLQEMKMLAVLSQTPALKAKDNLDCISGRTDTAASCTFGLSILQLYIWFSDCLTSIVHHLYVKIWLPSLAKGKVSVNSINSWKALLSEMGITLQFQFHCSAQTFESWCTEGPGGLYISQCI